MASFRCYSRSDARRFMGKFVRAPLAFRSTFQNPRTVCVFVPRTVPREICNLVSVVVITIRFKIVAYIIFCTAGVNISRAKLLQICFRISLHVVIRIGSVTYFICMGEKLWGVLLYGSRISTRFFIW